MSFYWCCLYKKGLWFFWNHINIPTDSPQAVYLSGEAVASNYFLNVHTDCLIKLLKSSLSARCAYYATCKRCQRFLSYQSTFDVISNSSSFVLIHRRYHLCLWGRIIGNAKELATVFLPLWTKWTINKQDDYLSSKVAIKLPCTIIYLFSKS